MNISINPQKFSYWLLIIVICFANMAYSQSGISVFDRVNYYKIMESGNLEAIENQLSFIDKCDFKNKDAFTGALIMKSAGSMKPPSKKLKTFKAGKSRFEMAFVKDSNNAELRFLRLMIQENAPKILGYHHELQKDRSFIIAHFNTLPEYTQQVIRNYSKKSKILSVSDF